MPPVRVQALARYAAAARAQAIARMPPPRRHATLLAFAQVQEATALDDVLDLLDQLITAMLARVEHAGQQRRLRTLKDLDRAALLLREACLVLLDPGCADRRVRDTVFARVPRDQLTQAVAQVADLVGPPDDHYYEDLRSRYSQVRRFLPALLEAVEFAATDAGRPAIEAFALPQGHRGAEAARHESGTPGPPDPGLGAARDRSGGPDRPPALHLLRRWNGSRTASDAATCSCPPAAAGATRTPSSCKGRPGRRCGRASAAPWAARPRRPRNWRASASSSTRPTGGPPSNLPANSAVTIER